jgi:hypothetical protein
MVKLSEEKIRQHIEKREAARILAENASCLTGPKCRTPPLQGPFAQQARLGTPSLQQTGGGGSANEREWDGPPGPRLASDLQKK